MRAAIKGVYHERCVVALKTGCVMDAQIIVAKIIIVTVLE